MFITKRHLSRRTFLQGTGVTLALPMLEAMVPAQTALAQTAASPKPRFVGIFYPHGNAPGYWEPEKEGPLPEKLPYIMESLEKVKDQTVLLSGLWSKSAEPPEGTTGSDHWVAAAFLTEVGRRAGKTFVPAGVSFAAARDAQFERLADLLEAHLDLAALDELIEGAAA